eukprot:Anaeramoba_ignava/a218641_14.p2 GENE.a218641_14~~a218641_14.p2  ORF type:complete len:233 (+),score=-10.41 a218641_14:183-881(+)
MGDRFQWISLHRERRAKQVIQYQLNNKKNFNIIKLAAHIAGSNVVDFKWYEEIFDYAPDSMLTGEMTPEYSLLNEASVRLLNNIYSDLKIIFIMREPLDRAISAVNMRLKQAGISKDVSHDELKKIIRREAGSWDIISRGDYEKIISMWKKYVPEEKMLVLTMDDIKEKPKEVLNVTANFLGVELSVMDETLEEKVHKGVSYNITNEMIDVIKENQASNMLWYKENIDRFRI